MWHEAHFAAWAPTAWSPGSFAGVWQLVQDGGVATPCGPWALWQVAQPAPGNVPWSARLFAAWHVGHVALARPVLGVLVAAVTLARLPE